MAQFALYRNRDPRTKAAIPLLVDIQNELLETLGTRVVIPLGRPGVLRQKPLDSLVPLLRIDDEDYLLLTPQLAGVDRSELGPAVGSAAPYRSQIVAALDFLVTGY